MPQVWAPNFGPRCHHALGPGYKSTRDVHWGWSMRPLTEEVCFRLGQLLCSNSILSSSCILQETKTVLEKLYKYIGKNIKNVVERRDEPHCFRLHSNRVYYVRESLMRRATNVSCNVQAEPEAQRLHGNDYWRCCVVQVGREQLVSLGQCIGKLTHSGKFRLTVGALDVLAAHAKYKVRIVTSPQTCAGVCSCYNSMMT